MGVDKTPWRKLRTITGDLRTFYSILNCRIRSISHILRALNQTLEPLAPSISCNFGGRNSYAGSFLSILLSAICWKICQESYANIPVSGFENHIFIGFSVIVRAIFALYGIYYVDAIIGLFIAAGIFIDALGLVQEVITTQKGIYEDSYQYKLPLQVLGGIQFLWPFEIGY